MLELPREAVPEVKVRSIPDGPGVHAGFRSGTPIYAGKSCGAGGLRGSVGKQLGVGPDLSRSSLLRNVAEHVLGVPTSVRRRRPSVMTTQQVATVNAWIQELEVAWMGLPAPDEAIAFERERLGEWMPPLSKR